MCTIKTLLFAVWSHDLMLFVYLTQWSVNFICLLIYYFSFYLFIYHFIICLFIGQARPAVAMVRSRHQLRL